MGGAIHLPPGITQLTRASAQTGLARPFRDRTACSLQRHRLSDGRSMDRASGGGGDDGQRFDSTSPASAEPVRRRRPVFFVVLLLGTTALLWVAAAARQLTLARATPLALRGADPQLAGGYLDCRERLTKLAPEHLRRSVDCFTGLVTQHPGFAPGYAGLADTYQLLGEYGLMPDGEAFPLAITAARKAVELDPSSSLGHRALAVAAFHWSFDVPTAEREFRTALDLDPEDAEAHRGFANALMLLGRQAEAMAQIDRARALEPASSGIAAERALILHRAGRTDEALGVLKELARIQPELLAAHRHLQTIDFERGDYAASLLEERSVAELLHDGGTVAAVTEEAET